MSDVIKEKLLEPYPVPVTIEQTKKILKQMENCICKIINSDGKGTGFFCYIPFENKKLPVLITNNHVINEKLIQENDFINVTLNDDKEVIEIRLDDDRKIYTNLENKYDTTIIEIRPQKDKINNFLELDKMVFEKNPILENTNVYIIQYPKLFNSEQKAAVSYGKINKLQNEYNITHYCSTEKGSSGSPILSLSNFNVIGVHKEASSSKKFNFNLGTFLKYPIDEYLNNINIIKKVKKSEYFKKINYKFKEEPKNLKYKLDITKNNDGSAGVNDIFEVFISYKDNKEYIASPDCKNYNLDILTLLDNKKIKSLKGHNTNIRTVRYFIDDKDHNEYLISGDNNCKVIIWDITNNYNIKYQIDNKDEMLITSNLLIFPHDSNDSYIILSTWSTSDYTDKSSTKLYSLNDSKYLRNFKNPNNNTIWYLISWFYKKNDKYYIIQLAKNKIIINNLLEDEIYCELTHEPEENHYSGFVYNKGENDYLCSSSWNGYINLWDLCNKVIIKSINANNGYLYHIIQWNDKFFIAADYKNKSFKILELENEKILDIKDKHIGKIKSIKKINHPKYGESLLIAGKDNIIKLWSK